MLYYSDGGYYSSKDCTTIFYEQSIIDEGIRNIELLTSQGLEWD